MRLLRFMLGSVMGRIVLMARHRSHRLSTVEVTKEPDGCQRPSNGQQERDEEQQNGRVLHPASKLSHRCTVAQHAIRSCGSAGRHVHSQAVASDEHHDQQEQQEQPKGDGQTSAQASTGRPS
jgi:hypothetical protein